MAREMGDAAIAVGDGWVPTTALPTACAGNTVTGVSVGTSRDCAPTIGDDVAHIDEWRRRRWPLVAGALVVSGGEPMAARTDRIAWGVTPVESGEAHPVDVEINVDHDAVRRPRAGGGRGGRSDEGRIHCVTPDVWQ